MDYEISELEVNDEQLEDLRTRLNDLIEEQGCDSLLHPEVIELSQTLDDIITSFNKRQIQINI